MHISLNFHGIPLTFDCDVVVVPEEKPSIDSPGHPAEVVISKIHFEGEEIDPDDDVWEALGLAATSFIRKH